MNLYPFYYRLSFYIKISFLGIGLCLVSGCNNTHDGQDNKSSQQDFNAVEQASNNGTLFVINDDNASSDDLGATLIGDFSGALACQSCDGMFISLSLYADGVAEKTITYSAKQNKMPDMKSGRYQQHKDRIALIYIDGQTEDYRIKDNQLILIKSTPKDPFSDEAGDYVLSRR